MKTYTESHVAHLTTSLEFPLIVFSAFSIIVQETETIQFTNGTSVCMCICLFGTVFISHNVFFISSALKTCTQRQTKRTCKPSKVFFCFGALFFYFLFFLLLVNVNYLRFLSLRCTEYN